MASAVGGTEITVTGWAEYGLSLPGGLRRRGYLPDRTPRGMDWLISTDFKKFDKIFTKKIVFFQFSARARQNGWVDWL
jgi:hypothetical protein